MPHDLCSDSVFLTRTLLASSQVWHAVPPPDSHPLTLGTITCSRKGPGITNLGGGDYDGDVICISWDDDLLNLVCISAHQRHPCFAHEVCAVHELEIITSVELELHKT